MTKLTGIFGYPLGHSISPAFQQAAFDHYAISARYEAWPTAPEDLKREISKLRNERYLGANVTVPHKEKVISLLDGIDSWAESIGAVNTIVREGSQLVGYNTDAFGFVRSLTEKGNFDPEGKRVVLLGAGGAARAAAYGLAKEGIASLTIANRTVERAERLAEEIRRAGLITNVSGLGSPELATACSEADLIVNSTSVGMWHGPDEESSPIAAKTIPTACVVYDMVYNPPFTPLLQEARKAGAVALGGLAMLIYQGAAAFEKWTGRKAPINVMFAAGENALSDMIATS